MLFKRIGLTIETKEEIKEAKGVTIRVDWMPPFVYLLEI